MKVKIIRTNKTTVFDEVHEVDLTETDVNFQQLILGVYYCKTFELKDVFLVEVDGDQIYKNSEL